MNSYAWCAISSLLCTLQPAYSYCLYYAMYRFVNNACGIFAAETRLVRRAFASDFLPGYTALLAAFYGAWVSYQLSCLSYEDPGGTKYSKSILAKQLNFRFVVGANHRIIFMGAPCRKRIKNFDKK
jgi:hypothetical protein